MKKLHTKERGITIITLVITIIILLILSGISIASLIGNDGLINRAKEAKEKYENKQEEELTLLDEYGNYIKIGEISDKYNSNSDGTLNEAILEEITKLKGKVETLENNTITLDKIYPVGSVYISTDLTTAEEVRERFGGTWERYGEGRTLVGVGTGTDSNSNSKTFKVNSTGGEYTHTLSIAEMPAHKHGVPGWAWSFLTDSTGSLYGIRVWDDGTINNTGKVTDEVGASQAHNIEQPYIAVYMWKRVS